MANDSGRRPLTLGLTGSIGMGKSTTAAMFADLSVPVFDADATVHAFYDSHIAGGGRAVPLIRAVFPDCVVEGTVDRTCLGAHMREDPLNLTVLESFIHPWVAEARAQFLAAHADASLVVFDIPLLFETGGETRVDHVAVVSCSPEEQRRRVIARPGMTDAMFDSLLARQVPDADKRARADTVLSTDFGVDHTRKAVAALVERLS